MIFVLSSDYCIIAVLINLNGCINTWEYLILSIQENCQMDNYGKFGKNCSYRTMFLFIDIVAFELGKVWPGVGTLFYRFGPGA